MNNPLNKNPFIILLAFLVLFSALISADESEEGNDLKEPLKNLISQAKVMAAATTKKDFGKVADLTHPVVIEINGGREGMISKTSKLMEKMDEAGYSVEVVKIGDPIDVVNENEKIFATIPQEVVMKFPSGKIISKSFLLAISIDKGEIWKFVDGQGITNKELKKRLLVPSVLKIPEIEKPKVIGNKSDSESSE